MGDAGLARRPPSEPRGGYRGRETLPSRVLGHRQKPEAGPTPLGPTGSSEGTGAASPSIAIAVATAVASSLGGALQGLRAGRREERGVQLRDGADVPGHSNHGAAGSQWAVCPWCALDPAHATRGPTGMRRAPEDVHAGPSL